MLFKKWKWKFRKQLICFFFSSNSFENLNKNIFCNFLYQRSEPQSSPQTAKHFGEVTQPTLSTLLELIAEASDRLTWWSLETRDATLGELRVKSGNSVRSPSNTSELICIAEPDEIKTFVAHSEHASVSGGFKLDRPHQIRNRK